MKLTVDAADLKGIVKSLAATNSPIVALDTEAGTATVQDPEIAVRITDGALLSKEGQSGTVVVNLKLLGSLLAGLKGEAVLSNGNGPLTLRAGRNKFTLPESTFNATVPAPPASEPHRLNLTELRPALVGALSVLDPKRGFSSILVKSTPVYSPGSEELGHAGIARIVSSDGARLFFAEVPSTLGEFTASLTERAVRQIVNVTEHEARLYDTEHAVFIESGKPLLGALAVCKKSAATFPDYTRYLNMEYKTVYAVNAEEVRQALSQLSPLVERDEPKISLKLTDGALTFSTVDGQNSTVADAREVSSYDVFNEPTVLSVSHTYLLDFFSVVKGEVLFKTNGPTDPIRLEAGRTSLIMTTMS